MLRTKKSWRMPIYFITTLYFVSISSPCVGLVRPDAEFKVFQFPKDNIPKIDGDPSDWSMVPASYIIGSDELLDTVNNTVLDKNDLDVTVKVGWVDGLDRLYFLYEAYDDYWDFKSTNLHNDIFEIVIDGDLTGGSFLPGSDMSAWEGYLFQGIYAQNYHIFTPAEGKSWCMVWGCQPWASEFPWANAAYSYNFHHSESGKLVFECYITPFDYAPYSNPEQAIPSELKENKIIGLSWSILDYDDENASGYDGFYNLSHKTSMYGDASDLVAFRLMPLEEQFHEPIEAQWSWKIIDMDQRCVEFTDKSYGNITSWKWDFGDGSYSTEQNPTHCYSEAGTHYIVVLDVEGPEGNARMVKVWDVAVGGKSVSIQDENPDILSLSQNYPNPFNPITTISFTIPQKNHVNISVYNTVGEKIAQLADNTFEAGKHSVNWNAQGYASGIYFARITTGEFTDNIKILLVK